jgi:hypothetical protein
MRKVATGPDHTNPDIDSVVFPLVVIYIIPRAGGAQKPLPDQPHRRKDKEHTLVTKKHRKPIPRRESPRKNEKDYEIRTGASGASGGSHGNIPGGLRSA